MFVSTPPDAHGGFTLERNRIRQREMDSKWLCRAKAASKQLYPKAIAAGRYLFI
jgi:hypothetical protein